MLWNRLRRPRPGRIAGTDIPGFDEGAGPVIIIVHPGFDDGTAWAKVAAHLAQHFRALRPLRRQYRPDTKGASACLIPDEARDMLAVAEAVGGPVVIVGHSSGAVVALETILAAPSSIFAGAVVYEPPLVTGPPLGGEGLRRARAALNSGRSAKAIYIFAREIVRMPAMVAWATRFLVAVSPAYRRRVRHQLDDVEAIDRLGSRLDAYRRIGIPVLIVQGDRSPAHLLARASALSEALPRAEVAKLRNQGHAAHIWSPSRLADLIAGFADRVLCGLNER